VVALRKGGRLLELDRQGGGGTEGEQNKHVVIFKIDTIDIGQSIVINRNCDGNQQAV